MMFLRSIMIYHDLQASLQVPLGDAGMSDAAAAGAACNAAYAPPPPMGVATHFQQRRLLLGVSQIWVYMLSTLQLHCRRVSW